MSRVSLTSRPAPAGYLSPTLVVPLLRLPVLAVLLVVASRGLAETDIWGHLRFGLDWLATFRLPHLDSYSFTTEQQWVNHEWISQVIFAFAFKYGGLPGLAALRVGLGAFLIAVLDRGLRQVAWPYRDVLLAVAIIGAIPQLSAVRPQFMSLILYPLCLTGIALDARWLPLVFVAWANLHGGWLIGLGAVLLHSVVRPSRRRLVLVGCCTAATLVNPYGADLWAALAHALVRGWSDVTEWRPLWAEPLVPANLALWAIVVGLAAWCGIRHRVPAGLFGWLWTVATAAAALQARRHLPFFVITTAMLVFSRWPARPGSVPLVPRRPRTLVLVGAFVSAICAAAGAALWPTATCLPAMSEDIRPEPSSVHFLRSSGLTGRMVTYFDWGLYAIWHAGDRFKVSVDNRRETVYSADVIAEHDRFYAGDDPDYPRRLKADVVWLPGGLPPIGQLRRRGWYLVFQGPRSVVLSRSYGPLTFGAGSPPGCFPAP